MKFISKSFPLLSILLIISCFDDQPTTKNPNLITSADTSDNSIQKKHIVQENSSIIDTTNKIPLFKIKMNITPRDSVISVHITKSKNDIPKNWKPPKKNEIIPIIKNFYELEGYDWNTCYGDLGYGLEGEIFFENRIYRYNLDAGGWIILYDKNKQRYFGCKGRECRSNFSSDCFCNENGIIDE